MAFFTPFPHQFAAHHPPMHGPPVHVHHHPQFHHPQPHFVHAPPPQMPFPDPHQMIMAAQQQQQQQQQQFMHMVQQSQNEAHMQAAAQMNRHHRGGDAIFSVIPEHQKQFAYYQPQAGPTMALTVPGGYPNVHDQNRGGNQQMQRHHPQHQNHSPRENRGVHWNDELQLHSHPRDHDRFANNSDSSDGFGRRRDFGRSSSQRSRSLNRHENRVMVEWGPRGNMIRSESMSRIQEHWRQEFRVNLDDPNWHRRHHDFQEDRQGPAAIRKDTLRDGRGGTMLIKQAVYPDGHHHRVPNLQHDITITIIRTGLDGRPSHSIRNFHDAIIMDERHPHPFMHLWDGTHWGMAFRVMADYIQQVRW